MNPRQTDLSVLSGFKFERPPVALKFEFFRPDSVEPLPRDKKLSLCEMLVEAQICGAPFYLGTEHDETCVGKILLGMQDMEPFAESGQIGERLKIFDQARANYALYRHVPRFDKNVVRYVVFSPWDKAAFEPDVLVMAADHSQAEIVLRSITYSTGELYHSRTTPVMGCAWLTIYPFQSGNVNFLVPDMVHGMKGRELFAANSILIAVPYRWIPTMARNLSEMTWHLPSHRSRSQYLEEFGAILGELTERCRGL